MLWHGIPPEVNTARLMGGAGATPMLQAATGWNAWAADLEAQAAELASSLTALSAAWTGMGSERGVSAALPMVSWLQTAAMQAQKRAAQATAQASSYTTAMATTPPLPEIAQNHITHAILEATNFLGINTVPIAINEADYMRMWNQAAAVMETYQAETMLNVMFEPIAPMAPIVTPGVGNAVLSAALGEAAAAAPGGAIRDAVLANVAGQAKLGSGGLNAGKGVNATNTPATSTQEPTSNTKPGTQAAQQDQAQQVPAQVTQVGSQLGSQITQIPQQFGQLLNPMQQLTQPLQQLTSMFGQFGDGTQMGLMGASPLSNHPLAGGSGASAGAGLMRAGALPGMSGSVPRTPLLAKLIDKAETPLAPAAVDEPEGAAAGASAKAGAAPVGGAGSGMGPMMMARPRTSGGTRAGLTAPAPLVQDLSEDEGDDW